jgi:hypothetical protein
MPAQQRLGLDYLQAVPPSAARPGRDEQEQAVIAVDPWSPDTATEHDHLLTEQRIFGNVSKALGVSTAYRKWRSNHGELGGTRRGLCRARVVSPLLAVTRASQQDAVDPSLPALRAKISPDGALKLNTRLGDRRVGFAEVWLPHQMASGILHSREKPRPPIVRVAGA